MAETYDDLIAAPAWRDDLRALNQCLIDSLTAEGEAPQIAGSPFYRHMQHTSILDSKFTTRNEAKRRRLFDIARTGRRLFEIGVNGGHGILLQKHANPGLSCTGLDLCQTAGQGNPRADIYCPAAMGWLSSRFPGDMLFLIGDSGTVLPAHVRANPGLGIDILRIDGARSNYYSDFITMRPLLHQESIVVFDDPHWPTARACIERAMAGGLLVPDRRFSPPGDLFAQDAVMRLP